ncbi:MAG TPA: ATP-binding protein [Sphingobium sp.]|nr:ATP-binding protein [Sphingobium sp.]
MATGPEALEGSDDLPPWWRTVPLILAILLAVALALIVYLADRAAEQRDSAMALQRHSFEVMMLATRLDGTIANAEVLLARYVVSLDKQTGLQFQATWRTAQAEVAALQRATRRSPEQHANVSALKEAIEERGRTLNDIALRTTYKQRLGALGRFYAAGKAPTVSRMREALKRTIDHEQAQLAAFGKLVDRSETRVSRVNDSYAVVGLGLLAAALLALWFAYGSARERRFVRRLAETEAQRVDRLEVAVRQRTEELQAANSQLRREMEERARAEQSLRHLQKMEAIGKLTGGIAHDFNNMLAVVVSGIDLARRALRRNPDKARQHLANAMEGANRAAALTTRLLAFARPDAPGAGRVDVDALVLDMHALIARATDDGIAVELDLDAGGWELWTEPAQLENAILNLAINARDAMDGRGTLTIATRCVTLAGEEVGQCAAGDYVAISVTDTGCGMTPDVIERAFEPFFTTKPIGKGTGLGLAQIFGFVRGAGGEIDVRSAPGEGTTIRMLLPREQARTGTAEVRAPMRSASAEEELETEDMAREGEGHLILVVEDDPRVLRSTLGALEALGHRGISCNHPRKAGDLLASNPDTALILSDVLMPDMTGPEMIAALGEATAGRPILFVTGYAGDGERAAQLSGMPVLRKPFTVAQLGQAIGQVLDASAAAQRAASGDGPARPSEATASAL